MEAAFATLALKDTNVKWNVRPTIQPPLLLALRKIKGPKIFWSRILILEIKYCISANSFLPWIVSSFNSFQFFEMEAAFAILAFKDTNVEWNVRPTIQPPTPLSSTQNYGTKTM